MNGTEIPTGRAIPTQDNGAFIHWDADSHYRAKHVILPVGRAVRNARARRKIRLVRVREVVQVQAHVLHELGGG